MKKHQLLDLNRLSPEEFMETDKHPVVLVLDNIRSGLNVGAAFRTADAFAIEKIFLCGISQTPPHREILKTAIGASKTVSWEHHQEVVDAVKSLQSDGYKIIVVEQTNESIWLQNWSPEEEKFAFVFGNEVNGVSDTVLPLADHALEIPQFGTKHSLNIAVSIGIVLWQHLSPRFK